MDTAGGAGCAGGVIVGGVSEVTCAFVLASRVENHLVGVKNRDPRAGLVQVPELPSNLPSCRTGAGTTGTVGASVPSLACTGATDHNPAATVALKSHFIVFRLHAEEFITSNFGRVESARCGELGKMAEQVTREAGTTGTVYHWSSSSKPGSDG